MTAEAVREDAPAEGFLPMIFSAISMQVIAVAVRLGLPDLLADRVRTVPELALKTGADVDRLGRLVRGLTALGYAEQADDGIKLTAAGSSLRRGDPSNMHAIVSMYGSPLLWQAMGELERSVRTGRGGVELASGGSVYRYIEQHADFAEAWHGTMAAVTGMLLPLVVHGYDYSRFRHIVDVGGGDGTLLAALLAANPQARGTVFDTAVGLRGAAEVLRTAGVADRAEVSEGDFFTAVPAGADAYVLKNVLIDWEDEDCVRILSRCREAMDGSGRVLVVGAVIPARKEPTNLVSYMTSVVSDLQAMVVSGRERTLAEYEALFRAAGLRLGEAVELPHYPNLYVVEAVAA